MSEVSIEPEVRPKNLWLKLSNICEKGKFIVALEIDGVEKEILHQNVEQEEGVVSQHQNLTKYLAKNAYIESLQSQLAAKDQEIDKLHDKIQELVEKRDHFEAACIELREENRSEERRVGKECKDRCVTVQ